MDLRRLLSFRHSATAFLSIAGLDGLPALTGSFDFGCLAPVLAPPDLADVVGFFFVDDFFEIFDEADDVPHAEDA